ncbi:MAG: tetratricopeptide repeat protein [Planctomycetota bacterium]|jgi:DNA-directed RNA polymerase subunit alpha
MEATLSVLDILDSSKLDLDVLDAIREGAYASEDQWREMRLTVLEAGDLSKLGKAKAIKYGYALYVLGRHALAVEELGDANASTDPVGAYVLGLCHLGLNQPSEALAAFKAGLKKDKNNLRLELGALEALRRSGDLKAALKTATALNKAHKGNPDILFELAAIREAKGEYNEAMDDYEDILDIDPNHANSLFRLAYNHEQRGGQAVAIIYYERLSKQQPTFANALINYGLLLEDLGKFTEAMGAYEKVLRVHPEHERARMFYLDAQASVDMYYDEDRERRASRRNAILRIPITDFELSVRARNCLNKMNIRSLGDLVIKTEEELLAYKNFGETSLHEIKQVLAQKGLRLGMFREQDEGEMVGGAASDGDEEVLKKPVAELDLSVRAKNCMERLNLRTIGELIQKSETELMGVKNFGQTSLNEVKQRLAEHGLVLKA